MLDNRPKTRHVRHHSEPPIMVVSSTRGPLPPMPRDVCRPPPPLPQIPSDASCGSQACEATGGDPLMSGANTSSVPAPATTRHVRRASAPPGLTNLALEARMGDSTMPPKAAATDEICSARTTSRKADGAIVKLRQWWDERVKKMQSSGMKTASSSKALLPVPAFLEEAFDNSESQDSFDEPQLSGELV